MGMKQKIGYTTIQVSHQVKEYIDRWSWNYRTERGLYREESYDKVLRRIFGIDKEQEGK